jgi:hypothetical protein
MGNIKTEDVTTLELAGILRRHKGGNAAFNALMDCCADKIEEFMGWEKEDREQESPEVATPIEVDIKTALDAIWKSGQTGRPIHVRLSPEELSNLLRMSEDHIHYQGTDGGPRYTDVWGRYGAYAWRVIDWA